MDKSFGDEETIGPAPKSGGHTYALKSGDLFGQYRVIRVLGAGGMGEVYEVEHKVLRRRYAIKLLPEALDWKGVSVERFEREAQVMANLDHPNILKVDEFGETDGRYWLRMEVAEGLEGRGSGGEGEEGARDESRGRRIVSLQDLADAHGGKIPQEELLPILRQVLEGLQYAHSHGAIHRDLKPSNILLSEVGGSRVEAGVSSPDPRPSPLAKISDFGLVRLVGEDWVRSQAQLSVQRSLSMGDEKTKPGAGESEGTSTRALLGTYEYMSPEQKRGEEADERSDLYAVGLMAYRLLTGRSFGMKLPSRLGFPEAWDDLIEAAVEEDLSERTESAAVMLVQMDSLSSEKAVLRNETQRPWSSIEIKESTPSPIPKSDGEIEPGTERTLDIGEGVELTLCWIPATTREAWKKISGGKDTFTMGSPEDEPERWDFEGPQHEVKLTRGFWMGKYPVTQRQYEKLTGKNPSYFKTGAFLGLFGGEMKPDHPVEQVSWKDSVRFCELLNACSLPDIASASFRLPTEAEWEYACRAGTTTSYHTGNGESALRRAGWYPGNSGGLTKPVGQKESNAWGLYDMHGNVWEWCQDGERTYSGSAVTDPGINDTSGSSARVLRGGSWLGRAGVCRSARRVSLVPGSQHDDIGFRVVVR